MNAPAELIERLFKKHTAKEPSILEEPERMMHLTSQIQANPERYLLDNEDRAFYQLEMLVRTAGAEIESVSEQIDSDYGGAAPQSLDRTVQAAQDCLDLDPHCYDALLMKILAQSSSDDEAIRQLMAIEHEAHACCLRRSRFFDGPVDDLWDAVFMRPYLRIRSKIIDLLQMSARYRLALDRSLEMLTCAPGDKQGIRHGTALLLARLEDERGLNELDAAYGRSSTPWMMLARAVLLYKLGRSDAASRAVAGLAALFPALAYFLVYPSSSVLYLPDRPPFTPGTIEECILAVYEADYLLMDTPDFADWAQLVRPFSEAVDAFHDKYGGDFDY